MITKRTAAIATPRIPLFLRMPWLSKRRIVLLAGLGTLAAGLALNWGWLTAAGIAPVLLSLLPCAAMCALGLCMRRGANGSCSKLQLKDAELPSSDDSRP